MTQEIQKILEMNRKGLLTTEQASVLLRELMDAGQPMAPGLGTTFNSAQNDNEVLLSGTTAPPAPTARENSLSLSSVDTPEGYRWEFHSNQFRTSSLKRIRLSDSKLIGNSFDGCRSSRLHLFHSALIDCNWLRSSVDSTHIKNSELRDCVVNHSRLNEVTAEECHFSGLKIADSRFNQIHFENCQLSGVTFKNLSVKKMSLKNLRLSNVVIDGTDSFFDLAEQE